MWLKPRDRNPRLHDQKHLWRTMGFGPAVTYTLATALTVSIVLNAAQGFERWHAAQQQDARVYVVAIDDIGGVHQIIHASRDWTPEDAVWIERAKLWLRNVRARTTDAGVWRWQMQQVRYTTDREVWRSLNDWLVRTRDQTRGRSVEVEIISATIAVRPSPNVRVVTVRWRERVREGLGQWRPFSANITLTRVPVDERTVSTNATGVWITGYDVSEEAA